MLTPRAVASRRTGRSRLRCQGSREPHASRTITCQLGSVASRGRRAIAGCRPHGRSRARHRDSPGYGDALLREVMPTKLQQFRWQQVVFRIGSDAFLLCAEGTQAGSANAVVNQVRDVVSRPVAYPGASTSVGLTCTIGATTSATDEDLSTVAARAIGAAASALAQGLPQRIVPAPLFRKGEHVPK